MESTNSQNDNLLHQMATYDFDSRINTILIFEDSGPDDIVLPGNISEKPAHDLQNKKINTVASRTSLPPNIIPTSSNPSYHRNPNIGNEESPFNVGQDSNLWLESIIRQSINNKTVNRQSVDYTPISSHDKSQTKTYPQTLELSQTKTVVRNITQNPQTFNHYSMLNTNPSREQMDRQNINKSPDYSTSPRRLEKNITRPARDSMISIEMIIMDTVSENLINIMKWYKYFNNHYMKNQKDSQVREKYVHYKHYFFDLSYSACVSIFIPQENNRNFLHRFITRTIEISNRKLWYYISSDHLFYLIQEMIGWAKQKKKHLESSFRFHRLRPPTDIVSMESNNMCDVQPNTVILPEADNSVCLFPSGSPGKEISTNVDSTMSGKKRNIPNNKINKDFSEINSPLTRYLLFDQPPKRRKTTEGLENQTSFTADAYKSSICSNVNPKISNLDNRANIMQPVINSDNIVSELRHPAKEIEVNRYLSPLPRSASRDSGCESPVLVIDDSDMLPFSLPPSPNSYDNLTSLSGSPDVSSKNPAALINTFGPCKNCGTLTKKMCKGCEKNYYCTDLCQKKDWFMHKNECRAINTSKRLS